MKAFICFLALATATNAGLIHHAPGLSHGAGSLNLVHVQDAGLGGGLSYGGGLGYGGGLAYGSGLGGLGYGNGLALGGAHHQVIKVIHQEQAPLLLPAPAPAHLVKVIHQAPVLAPAPTVVRVINHHAPAPAPLKIVKVLHQAPTGW